jgi:hypothetical protein
MTSVQKERAIVKRTLRKPNVKTALLATKCYKIAGQEIVLGVPRIHAPMTTTALLRLVQTAVHACMKIVVAEACAQ